MSSSLLQRVRSYFDDRSQEPSGQEVETSERPATSLRTCPDCNKTFIVEEMEHCPSCGTAVEETPTEKDLGFW